MDAKNDLTKFTSDLGLSEEDLNASVMLWKQDVQQFAMGTIKLIHTVAITKVIRLRLHRNLEVRMNFEKPF